MGRYATALLPFDAPVPSGLFARRVTQIRTSYIQEADSCNLLLRSGTPYIILSGRPVDITATQVSVSLNGPNLGTDTLQGTWTNRVATATQWVTDDADTQYFNTCTGEVIPALTAYLEYTKKVRVNSYPYNVKDKKAKQLAQRIAEVYACHAQHQSSAPETAQEQLLDVLREAEDTLRAQPVTALQTARINALEVAASAYVQEAEATENDGPKDKTPAISNPSFELGTSRGWTAVGASVRNITSVLANYMAGADGTYVLYAPAGTSLSQTLRGLEPGTYRLTACLATDYGGQVALFAGADTLLVQATDFGPMYFTEATLDGIRVTDGTLAIGMAGVGVWAKADHFRLYLTETDPTLVEPVRIQTRTAPSGIYDLSGRRLIEDPRVGIYIQDGRKQIR